MSKEDETCGLYLITPEAIDDIGAFAAVLDAVLATRAVACVQLRLKGATDDQIAVAAEALLPVCHKYDVPLLINDRADIAAAVDADGVHLGQNDGDVAAARTLLGADKDIGVTCHGSKDLAYVAGDQGANYVAFGAFFPSETKPEAEIAEMELLTTWDEITEIPAVAIGGIDHTNCKALADAGAHFVAVCASIWGAEEGPVAAVQTIRARLDT